MSKTTTTTQQVICPVGYSPCAGKCGGEAVTATFGPKTVKVSACSFLQAQGWTGPGMVLFHSQATTLVPADAPVILRHRDGLVTFSA